MPPAADVGNHRAPSVCAGIPGRPSRCGRPTRGEPLLPRHARRPKRASSKVCGSPATLAQDTSSNEEHPVVQHLRMVADHLAAGRDMLETHFITGPFGARAGNSYWAPVITAAPVTTALLAELAAYARGLAPWAAKLSVTGPSDSGVPVSARMALHAACCSAARPDSPHPRWSSRLSGMAEVPLLVSARSTLSAADSAPDRLARELDRSLSAPRCGHRVAHQDPGDQPHDPSGPVAVGGGSPPLPDHEPVVTDAHRTAARVRRAGRGDLRENSLALRLPYG